MATVTGSAIQLWQYRSKLQNEGAFGETEALILHDICAELGFNETEIQSVMGIEGLRLVNEILDTRIGLTPLGEMATGDLQLSTATDRPSGQES